MNFTRRSLGAVAAIAVLGLSGCGLKPSATEVPQVEPAIISHVEGSDGQKLTVGAKNFTEQLILGKIGVLTAQAAGFDVQDMTNIPGSQPARKVMLNGEVDMEWEYTGTAWLTYLNKPESINDPHQMWESVRKADEPNGLTWGKPSPLNNTYSFGVREDYAKKHNLKNISDIAKVPPKERTLCIEAEFNSRPDGLNGMLKKYGLERGSANGIPDKNISIMDTGTVYTATAEGTCNFGEIFTTDGRINSLNLTVLEDDQKYFPAYSAAPVFSTETLNKYPGLAAEYDKVAQRMNNEVLRKLNYKVDVEGQEPSKVAYDWMVSEGLIKPQQ